MARERDVAQGFIKEMAKRVAGDKELDFDGMKQQVQKAIEIYETEIAGRPIETNIDASVDVALAKARAQFDQGQSRLARATLRRAAEEMRREEEERRERYIAGATRLYNRERDFALAAYDGDAAADAIVALAEALHGANAAGSMILPAHATAPLGGELRQPGRGLDADRRPHQRCRSREPSESVSRSVSAR